MTDFELSKAIATLHFKDTEWRVGEFNGEVLIYNSHIKYTFNFNNWSDLMPLVVEHEIAMDFLDGYGRQTTQTSAGRNTVFTTVNENPQRALALCLLKVLEAKVDE